MAAINVVFDGPLRPQMPRFVEVEDDHGRGVTVGGRVEATTWRVLGAADHQRRGRLVTGSRWLRHALLRPTLGLIQMHFWTSRRK